MEERKERKSAVREWLITILAILLVIFVWVLTIKDGQRLLNSERNSDKEKEPAPYYSKESGEDEDVNP